MNIFPLLKEDTQNISVYIIDYIYIFETYLGDDADALDGPLQHALLLMRHVRTEHTHDTRVAEAGYHLEEDAEGHHPARAADADDAHGHGVPHQPQHHAALLRQVPRHHVLEVALGGVAGTDRRFRQRRWFFSEADRNMSQGKKEKIHIYERIRCYSTALRPSFPPNSASMGHATYSKYSKVHGVVCGYGPTWTKATATPVPAT